MRTGGGWISIDDFLEQFSAIELEKMDKVELRESLNPINKKPFSTGQQRGTNGQMKGVNTLILSMESGNGLGIIREATRTTPRGNISVRSGGSSRERSASGLSQNGLSQRKFDRERTMKTLGRYEEVDPEEYQRQ